MDHEPPTNEPHGLGPPRFRLGSLLGGIAALCLVLASYTWFGPSGALLFGLFALAVLAHITGNWLGNQLRDIGDHNRVQRYERTAPAAPRKLLVEEHHYAPATSLRHHRRMSKATRWSIAAGALATGLSGATVLAIVHWNETTWTSLALVMVALMVLGGIFTFLCLSFVQAGWHAWSEATRDRKRG